MEIISSITTEILEYKDVIVEINGIERKFTVQLSNDKYIEQLPKDCSWWNALSYEDTEKIDLMLEKYFS